jgi:hypothetical protein
VVHIADAGDVLGQRELRCRRLLSLGVCVMGVLVVVTVVYEPVVVDSTLA